jgi:hypothetical protein
VPTSNGGGPGRAGLRHRRRGPSDDENDTEGPGMAHGRCPGKGPEPIPPSAHVQRVIGEFSAWRRQKLWPLIPRIVQERVGGVHL